jgi:hypothetical protein
MPTTEEPLWESTSIQNLIRYRLSGTYFARFKVGGKLVRQSLETAVFSVAKQRLPDKIREFRSRHESVKALRIITLTQGLVLTVRHVRLINRVRAIQDQKTSQKQAS